MRTNLSPFTKDFRVEVQYNESIDSFLGCLDGYGCRGDNEVVNGVRAMRRCVGGGESSLLGSLSPGSPGSPGSRGSRGSRGRCNCLSHDL